MSSNLREAAVSAAADTARSRRKRTPWFWLSAWLPVALGIAVILFESTEFMGADHTSSWLRHIYEAIFGRVSYERWDHIHHYIRKAGHFLGYGLIGLAWLRAWWLTLPHSRFFTDVLLAILGTAAIASSDEWHQGLLPNRTSSPWDVLIDVSGALVLQLAVYICLRLLNAKRLSRPTR